MDQRAVKCLCQFVFIIFLFKKIAAVCTVRISHQLLSFLYINIIEYTQSFVNVIAIESVDHMIMV